VDNCDDAIPVVKTAFSQLTGVAENKITVTKGAGCAGVSRRRLETATKELNVEIDATQEEVQAAEEVITDTETFAEDLTEEIETIVQESDDPDNHPLAQAEAATITEPQTTELAREEDDTESSSSFPILIIIVAIVVVLIAIAGVLYCKSSKSTETGGDNLSDMVEMEHAEKRKVTSEVDLEAPQGETEGDVTTKRRITGKQHRLSTEQLHDIGVRE